jgi:hypothetical protein
MEPEPEVTEADPDDPRALIKEIRRHDLKDIPHKAEHLLEEDETYDADSPAHHMDDIPAGYRDYPVVDETNSHDMEIFEMAEREPAGIEGDRTTEQMMIEEMELRQQPGDPTRDVSAQSRRRLVQGLIMSFSSSCETHSFQEMRRRVVAEMKSCLGSHPSTKFVIGRLPRTVPWILRKEKIFRRSKRHSRHRYQARYPDKAVLPMRLSPSHQKTGLQRS